MSREKRVAVSHVFVVDPQALILEAVRLLCDEHSELTFAGGASSVPEATRALAEAPADVLMIDMELPDGLDLVQMARERWPATAILAVHGGAPTQTLRQALEMGAVGAVEKSADIPELVGAIRRAASGGPRTHGTASGPAPGQQVRLSPRERTVLRLLARGRSNAEIARELSISPRTVASHVASIYRRLQVETRVDAATAAIRLGIASDEGADPQGDT